VEHPEQRADLAVDLCELAVVEQVEEREDVLASSFVSTSKFCGSSVFESSAANTAGTGTAVPLRRRRS